MTQQAIMIDALGRIKSEHREDSPVNMAEFGQQEITRFSEVLHDTDFQCWYVVFRSGAPDAYHGGYITLDLAEEAGADRGIPNDALAFAPGVAVCTYALYSEAVEAERAVLRWMMRTGKFHDG